MRIFVHAEHYLSIYLSITRILVLYVTIIQQKDTSGRDLHESNTIKMSKVRKAIPCSIENWKIILWALRRG